MFLLRHGLEMMVNPFFIALLFLTWATVLSWFRHARGLIRWPLIVSLSIMVVMSTGWMPRWITYRLENQYPIVHSVNPSVSWVVVLSGGQAAGDDLPANDLLTSASIKRLVEGVRLFRQMDKGYLVLSGGAIEGIEPEAHRMAELAQWFAIPEKQRILELDSLNTADQAKALHSIVHDNPFYLVTSAIHMPRAMALCKQQGLNPIAAPTDFSLYWMSDDAVIKMMIPNTYNMAYSSIALHEVLGRLWLGV